LIVAVWRTVLSVADAPGMVRVPKIRGYNKLFLRFWVRLTAAGPVRPVVSFMAVSLCEPAQKSGPADATVGRHVLLQLPCCPAGPSDYQESLDGEAVQRLLCALLNATPGGSLLVDCPLVAATRLWVHCHVRDGTRACLLCVILADPAP
jgi:hypothetical protein